MNTKQILKEIAYYSKLIDNHKKHVEKNTSTHNFYKPFNVSTVSKNTYDINKYKYVKPESSVILPVLPKPKETPRKVLINPNFKQSVHINPRFKPKSEITSQTSKPVVHVNPKIINIDLINKQTQVQTVFQPTKSPSLITPQCFTTRNETILRTPNRKRLNSIRTKYKIVKSDITKFKSPVSKILVKNRFKIDRRSKSVKGKQKKKIITQSINDSIRTCLFKNKTWRKSPCRTEQNNVNNVAKTNKNKQDCKNKRAIITLRGKKYTAGFNKKSLKLIPSRKNSFSNKKIKSVNRSRKFSLSQLKVVSVTSLSTSRIRRRSTNKNERSNFRKNNIPCPVYRRFGKCRRKDAGRCIFKHNPDQIALCKNFLQGACLDDDCLLSHKVSLEKMPTCKYFLEGCCVRSNCPYLHVKISPNAEICKNFLEGFCKEAIKCNKRHQYLCPDFERHGKCEKHRCRFPHRNKSNKEKSTKPSKSEESNSLNLEVIGNVEQSDVPRYYTDHTNIASSKQVSIENGLENDEIYKRIKLGALPSFIPID